MTETIVQKKLSKLIQREVSQIISMGTQYVPNTMLTVSIVRVTRDLSLARIYISAFPESKLAEAIQRLNDQAWEVRHALAARIRNKVRSIPELRFFEDDTLQEAKRIEELLDTIEIKPEEEAEEDASKESDI